MSSLQGKTAVATGGSRGIGAGIVRKLASRGANVGLSYLANGGAAEKIVGEFKSSGSRVVAVKADVTNQDDLVVPLSMVRLSYVLRFSGVPYLIAVGPGTTHKIGDVVRACAVTRTGQ